MAIAGQLRPVKFAPYIAHEYLNLGLKFDPRSEPRFTGAMCSPRDMKSYENLLHRVRLSRAWGEAYLHAGHAPQRYYQKQGIETARLDPSCGGYSYWTIVDVLVKQGDTYTGQGLYNAFSGAETRRHHSQQFRKFNGPTAILCVPIRQAPLPRPDRNQIECSFWISHFGNAPLKGAKLAWTFREADIPDFRGDCPNFRLSENGTVPLGGCPRNTCGAGVSPARAAGTAAPQNSKVILGHPLGAGKGQIRFSPAASIISTRPSATSANLAQPS